MYKEKRKEHRNQLELIVLEQVIKINPTLKRGERRRDDADPGDRSAALLPLARSTFFKFLLCSSDWCSCWDKNSLLLSVEMEETGADTEIMKVSWSRDAMSGNVPECIGNINIFRTIIDIPNIFINQLNFQEYIYALIHDLGLNIN